jgi:Flp pilus assembly protein TadD
VNANPARPPPTPFSLPRLTAWAIAAGLALATLVAYRGALSGPFVLDDTRAITDNFSIRSLATAWSPPPDTTTSGRPVVNLSLALNYALGGLAVEGYHLFNLAVHALAALALFGIVRRTLQSPRIAPALARDATPVAGGIALLWALHPLQTESVTYTIQRAESLMGFFYLLTLYAFIRGAGCHPWGDNRPARHSRAWLVVSFAACLLGMATKEVMASAPLLVLLYDRAFVAGNFRAALRVRAGYYAALAATWLPLAALVISAENRGGTAGLASKIAAVDYALTQCFAIVHYLRLALWPAPLVFDYGNATFTAWPLLAGPALVLLALVGGTLVALRTRPMLGFLGAAFFAILAPSSSFVPIATQTIAEHRMYLPLAAVLTLVVLGLHRLDRRAALAATLVLAGGCAMLTGQRNATYRDALTLWTDTAAKAPDNVRAHTNLGLALLDLGRTAEARTEFAAALRLRPDQPDTHVNSATVLGRLNRLDEAIGELETALRLAPDQLEARNNLGALLAQRGRLDEAIAQFERAVHLAPASAESHSNLGRALLQAGRTAEAVVHGAESVRLRPLDPFFHDSYGTALLVARRVPEAITEFETTVRIDPASASAHHHLGLAFNRSDRTVDGLAQLARAVELSPNDAQLRNDLGIAYAMSDRIEEALREFERAVALNPGLADAVRNRDRARAQAIGQ